MKTMKSVYLLLAAVVICSVSGLPALNGRIAGGGSAAAAQFPYVVSISEKDRHICGGFIYNARWIVTAASCVAGKLTTNLKVTAGQVSLVDKEPSEQTLSVFSIVPVDVYNSSLKLNDIALVKLTTDLNLTVTPTDVNFAKYGEATDDTQGVVMGWGATFEGGFESINLHYAAVDVKAVTADDSCGDYAYGTEFKPATMLCAAPAAAPTDPDAAGAACHFDEGSPLVQKDADAKDLVVGIMSQTKTCNETSPGVYTRVSVYYSWLINTAGPQPAA